VLGFPLALSELGVNDIVWKGTSTGTKGGADCGVDFAPGILRVEIQISRIIATRRVILQCTINKDTISTFRTYNCSPTSLHRKLHPRIHSLTPYLSMARTNPNIIVTGTPGVGKTTHAEQLARSLGFKHISVNQIVKDEGFHEGKDEETGSWIVDEEKVRDHYFNSNFAYVYIYTCREQS
jgi:Cdc6-like AAA superfamily ATPase